MLTSEAPGPREVDVDRVLARDHCVTAIERAECLRTCDRRGEDAEEHEPVGAHAGLGPLKSTSQPEPEDWICNPEHETPLPSSRPLLRPPKGACRMRWWRCHRWSFGTRPPEAASDP